MFPHGPLNAKGTAEIAPGIAILENQAILVILIFLAKQAILAILAHHFRAEYVVDVRVCLALPSFLSQKAAVRVCL